MTISYSNNILTPKEQAILISQQEKVGGFGASMAALGTLAGINSIATPLSAKLIIPMAKKQGPNNENDIKAMQDIVKKVINKTGLDKKGVNIKFLKQYSKEEAVPLFIEISNPIEAVKNGNNAFYFLQDAKILDKVIYKKGTILAPSKDMSHLLFHEVGHAHNNNLSKIGNTLQKMRGLSIYIPSLIALYGIITRKSKPKEDQNLTTLQKTNNFIRNNAGKLSLIFTLPMLIEEAMATAKGNKWAKEFLNPNDLKKVTKGCRIAYVSYILTGLTACLGSWAAVKVKDKMIENKEKKREELINCIISSK